MRGAPFFHPEGKRIIFSSEHTSGRRHFDWTGADGLDRLTYQKGFNVFVAEWREVVDGTE